MTQKQSKPSPGNEQKDVLQAGSRSSINLIKRPRISKTTVPHFIDDLDSLHVILTVGPGLDGQNGPSPHTILVVIGERDDLVAEKLVGPPTLAAEITCADLYRY